MQNLKPVSLVEEARVDEIMAERVLKNLKVRNLLVHTAGSEFRFEGYSREKQALLSGTAVPPGVAALSRQFSYIFCCNSR